MRGWSGVLGMLAVAGRAAAGQTAVPADARFFQGMIWHHAQAVAMAALVPDRTSSDVLRLLAERITVSQRDEIALMQRWLRARGADAPTPDLSGHAAAGDHEMRMPGMLTAAELAQLAAARGAAFDRLFLAFMIRHHEGALTMVGDLFASPGAAQDPEVFRLASDIDADQRAEIRRMRALLGQVPPAPESRAP